MTFTKDPNAILDYTIDWRQWLQPGEKITTSTWTVTAGITKDSDARDSQSTTIWLSGGTTGTTYTIQNRIATDQGRTEDRSFYIAVQER